MMSRMPVFRCALIVFAVMGVGAWSAPPPPMSSRVTIEMLPNPSVLRVLGRSQIEFVADLLWVRMGSMASRAERVDEYAALLPIGNLIADVDPRFKYPYFVAGVLAPVWQGKGKPYANTDGARAIMQRGIEAVPTYLRLYVQKAYIEFFMLHQPLVAAKTLRGTVNVPGAPVHLQALATRLYAQGGQFDQAEAFAREMAQSDDPEVRADFETRSKEIQLERVLVTVDKAAEQYRATTGRVAATVRELVDAALLPSIPADPFGGAIELRSDGAYSTAYKGRLRAFVQVMQGE